MTISTFSTEIMPREIEVTSVYFRNNPAKQRVESYPRRMVYDGQEYTFREAGMRYLVRKGQELIRLFDVSDGQTLFRLRLDQNDRWTLVNMRGV